MLIQHIARIHDEEVTCGIEKVVKNIKENAISETKRLNLANEQDLLYSRETEHRNH